MLSAQDVERGLRLFEEWYDQQADKDQFVIYSGSEEDCWTPRKLRKALNEKAKSNEWNTDDIPERIMESILKTKLGGVRSET